MVDLFRNDEVNRLNPLINHAQLGFISYIPIWDDFFIDFLMAGC